MNLGFRMLVDVWLHEIDKCKQKIDLGLQINNLLHILKEYNVEWEKEDNV